MTQRIFDIENEKDMQDLWEILPKNVTRIIKDELPEGNPYNRYYVEDYGYTGCSFIAIKWYDKTEITRPVDYEDMIGCVGWFWDNTKDCKIIGILTRHNEKREIDPFLRNDSAYYCHFCPAKKSELKFWGED